MSNKSISSLFKLGASLMELHGANPFKVKAFQSAQYTIDNSEKDLLNLNYDELIDAGLKKGAANTILEIKASGSFNELDEYLDKTPKGVVNLLSVKGIGAKKVKTLWEDLGIESKSALMQACKDGKVAALKGFGKKTEEKIILSLQYEADQKGKYQFAEIEATAINLREALSSLLETTYINCTGEIARKLPVITTLEYTLTGFTSLELIEKLASYEPLIVSKESSSPFIVRAALKQPEIDLVFKLCPTEKFINHVLLNSSSSFHQNHKIEDKPLKQLILTNKGESEKELYESLGLKYIVPELREGMIEFKETCPSSEELITKDQLKGILHNHSTYSDGKNTLREMAEYCLELGYEYLGISDHSVSAFYARGLDEDRIIQQHKEIDELNKELAPFKIFKGIESDILNDGSLDYPDDVLKSFDFIVSSVHSNLNMDREKATQRLITAIENPHTTILGHMTGRLLLRREGYPIDHAKVIDACAENGVIIEINANPWRLDIDWTWVPYALEKGVMLSINPDAHEINGYHDMQYGVYTGRKGGLTAEKTLNTMSRDEIETYFNSRKK